MSYQKYFCNNKCTILKVEIKEHLLTFLCALIYIISIYHARQYSTSRNQNYVEIKSDFYHIKVPYVLCTCDTQSTFFRIPIKVSKKNIYPIYCVHTV